VLLRISFGSGINSDGANNALQAWDLSHGNPLLHGWLIGDANFYFFELPLNAITAAVFGLGNLAMHAASALAFLLVAVCAVALAVAGSRGPARLVRCAVVVMVLAAPMLTSTSMHVLLEEPDHIGTTIFVLVSFLLADLTARAGWESAPQGPAAPARRYIAPLVCVILALGQFSDVTVRYVAVPAIVLVCGYRALAARRLRSQDTALVAAAVISVPLATLANIVFVHLGGFTSMTAKARLAPAGLWAHQASITWTNLRLLFGAVDGPFTKLGAVGFAFATVCMLAVAAGLAWALWQRGRASRADQMLCVAIVCNVGIALVSTLALPGDSHEMAVVLPCGAVLAARLVPARITDVRVAFAAVTVAGLAAVLPLAVAATLPEDPGFSAPLVSWLEAHNLRYGIANYWNASAPTLQSGGRVWIITANPLKPGPGTPRQVVDGSWYEVNTQWYDPAQHDATFALADGAHGWTVQAIESAFGKPAASHRVQRWTILIYRKNLLTLLGASPYPRPA